MGDPPPPSGPRDGLARRMWRSLDEWTRRDPLGRRARFGFHVACAPGEFVQRRQAARRYVGQGDLPYRIDPELGYVRIPAGELQGVEGVLARCRERRDELLPELPRIEAAKTGKFRIIFDLLCDEVLERDPTFVDFALSDGALRPVVEYLGTVPYLARVALARSVHLADVTPPAYNQRFHLDADDLRQVKMFVNVEPVGDTEGPLTFLDAPGTRRVLEELAREDPGNRRRTVFTDEEVLARCDPSELVALRGEPGEAVLVDLSRCLHFGSRLAPGHDRLVLVLVYLRYHRVHGTPCNAFQPSGREPDRVRSLALRQPRHVPAGYYFPDPVLHPSPADRGRRGLAAR